MPVIFSELIAIFQEREDVGPREAIFTQVLFFDVVICCLHLGKEAITRLLNTSSHCSSLCLSIHCGCWGDLPHLALEINPSHLSYRKVSAAPVYCNKHCSPLAKAGHRSSQWCWSLCSGQGALVHWSDSKSSSQNRKQKKPEGERFF